MSVYRFWSQQDSNPRPGYYHADVLPLRHFDPHKLSVCFLKIRTEERLSQIFYLGLSFHLMSKNG